MPQPQSKDRNRTAEIPWKYYKGASAVLFGVTVVQFFCPFHPEFQRDFCPNHF
jgi:hypothetical protein